MMGLTRGVQKVCIQVRSCVRKIRKTILMQLLMSFWHVGLFLAACSELVVCSALDHPIDCFCFSMALPMKSAMTSPISRHFDRSGEANQVSLKLGSKSGKQQLPESSSTSKSCNLVCFVDETSNTVFALLTLFASLSFEPVVQITRMLRLHCWNILLGIYVGLTVLTSCFCGFDLTCFLLLPFRDGSLCLLGSLLIVLLNLAAQWVCLLALVCVAVMHVPSKLTVCRRSHVVVVRKSLWPDLLGGTGLEEIGSKSWLDNILQGLNARQFCWLNHH